MEEVVRTAKALADESRVRILGALRKQELCVCQLIELLGLAPSTVSKHLSILRQASLVLSRKEGRWIYYRLAGEEASETVTRALGWGFDSLARSAVAIADDKRLKAILRIDPEELCSRQAGKGAGVRAERVAAPET